MVSLFRKLDKNCACIYHFTRATSPRSEQLRSMYSEFRNFITPGVTDYLHGNSEADMRPCCWQHTSYPCLRLEMTLSPWCCVQVAATVLCPATHSFVVTAFRRICRLFAAVVQFTSLTNFRIFRITFCFPSDFRSSDLWSTTYATFA
jgi:hypothetical protein